MNIKLFRAPSRTLVCFIVLGFSLNSLGQKVFTIHYGNLVYMRPNEAGYALGNYVLKDSLPDGKWVVVQHNANEKAIHSNDVLIEAYYFDGQKCGTHTVYSYRTQKKKRILVSTNLTTYKQGVLDGSYQFWRDSLLVESGEFSGGKKNGEWIFYTGNKRKSLIYRSDTLISKEEIVDGKTIARWSLVTNVFTRYDGNGHVDSQTSFKKSEAPITYKYHLNDTVAEVGYGQFMDIDVLAAYEHVYETNTWTWRGKIGKWKYYDGKGNLIKEE